MKKSLSRRHFLGATTAALVGLAGCNQLQSSSTPEETTIVDARLTNKYREPRELSVSFERDGELVYWRHFELEAAGANDQGPGSADLPVDSLSDEPAEWTIEVLNVDAGNFRSTVLSGSESTEIRLDITISPDDSIEILTSA